MKNGQVEFSNKKGVIMFKKILLVFFLSLFLLPVFSLEIGGKNLPDTKNVGEKNLILNGAGIRKKLIIKVYACGLYLTDKNSNSETILNANEPIAIRMHFIYKKVASEKLVNAWDKGFSNNNVANSLQPKIDKFNSFFTESAKKNDIYEIIYLPEEGTSVFINSDLKGTIKGFEFRKAVFSIWLGENTALPKLKEKLLGM